MPRDERAVRIIRDRRRIIATLKMVYPGHIEGEELYRVMLDTNPEYDRRSMCKDMDYLHGKGYVTFRGIGGVEQRTISVKRCQFKLTPAGTDIADDIVDDPTLELFE